MKPTLVVLAAGMASRYGSMKQTEGFGPAGETIMDYSVYDAIRAGFGKVVFIIRPDFAEGFKANFDEKLKGKIEVAYVYQEIHSLVDPQYLPAGRTKPWGTAHAMLCAKDAVDTPFAVINADDFYGADGFVKAYQFLTTECDEHTYAIVGYELSKTLSEFGTVSRGVCSANDAGDLVNITERVKLYKKDGVIVYEENDTLTPVQDDAPVSMNFWCFHPSVFTLLGNLFNEFSKNNMDNIKAEFFIPLAGDHFINEQGGTIRLIPTSAQWFGVTYKEDAPSVKAQLDALIADGEYSENIWDTGN